MKKGAKRKADATAASRKDEAVPLTSIDATTTTTKVVWKTKRSKPESDPEFFNKQRELEDLWKHVFPVGTEWDQLDLLSKYKWNFSNLEGAFEEGGVLHGKKVYLFSCTEQVVDNIHTELQVQNVREELDKERAARENIEARLEQFEQAREQERVEREREREQERVEREQERERERAERKREGAEREREWVERERERAEREQEREREREQEREGVRAEQEEWKRNMEEMFKKLARKKK